MTLLDIFQETFSAIYSNKVRSGLTILGIVIGIGSVIALVAIGQGAQGSIESSIQSIGSNLVLVTPGMQRVAGGGVSSGRGSAQTLTQEDSDAIQKNVSSVKAVAPEISKRYQVTAKGTNTNTSIIGTVPAYESVRSVEVESGSFISDQNIKSTSKVAVIGPTTRDDLFGVDTDPIGQKIKINKIEFKIVGVMKAKGGTGFGSQDDRIFVPISTAQRYLSGDTYVTTISVEAENQQVMTEVQSQITALLMERHKISDPLSVDFTIMNQADIVATASSITNTFTMLLGAIAGISLIVGGIGIMNMMLTTVTERTREIGLRKAVGAKRRDINLQFLIEAAVLTLIGGILGVFLGWITASIISNLTGMATSVTLSSVFLAFGVSTAIGIIFGYYPARQASKMNPIQALRYE